FRVQLGAGAVVSRWLDDCLAIHTQQGWDELAAKVAALPITDPAARRFSRLIFAGAAEVELDRRGRILLPGYLRDHLGLGSEAVVVGSRDHAEIWVPDAWATYGKQLEDPDELAQAFEGLGI
ncbi:MAG: division/cell wall cluster transcriptional repressor MraZ, partial [Candidatus Limnocylindria bacterium]